MSAAWMERQRAKRHPKWIPKDEAAARYPHGSRARYCLGKCRCSPCRRAAADYEHDRQNRERNPWRLKKVRGQYVVRNVITGEIAHGDEATALLLEPVERADELIPTGEVIRHCRALQCHGVGLKTIAKRAPIAYSVLCRILVGDVKRTRRSTAERILAVSRSDIRGGARIEAGPTNSLVDALVAAGYRRYWIAKQLGFKAPALQIGRGKTVFVAVRNARKVHGLYVALMATDTALPRIPLTFSPAGAVAETSFRRSRKAAHD